MMGESYILVDRKPVKCDDVKALAAAFKEENRRVAFTKVNDKIEVSTVFLSLDHRHSDEGEPLLFETMVFRDESRDDCERCSTWDEAVAQHKRIVAEVSKQAGVTIESEIVGMLVGEDE